MENPNDRRTARSLAALCCLAFLAACAPESPTEQAPQGAARNKPALDSSRAKPIKPGQGVTAKPPDPPALPAAESPPTRSELRVAEEQRSYLEADIKQIIQDFDANLDNRQERSKAEDAFRASLPEYKEKMLALGKAKLKLQNAAPEPE